MKEKRQQTWQQLRNELGIGRSKEGRAAYERARQLYELGVQVRTLRLRRGLTLAELAKRVGTNQAAIARIEAGGPEPRLSTLERVGRALDADLVVAFRERDPSALQPT
jgi:DNA-binding XRE family transcriptional regulator